MGLYEYVVGLMTIVSGLALTEIALRLSRLIEHRRTVRWDALPLLCALLGIGTLVVSWSNAWHPDNAMAAGFTVGAFMIPLFANLMLYMTIATTLPSDPAPDTDLRAFYDTHNATFWSLFTLTMAQFIVRVIVIPAFRGEPVPLWVWPTSAAVLGLGIAPIFWRNRLFHYLATIGMILLIVGPALFTEF